MLILQNLSYQTAKKSFLNSSKKLIKFEFNQQLHSVKTPAKVKSPALVEWTDSVSLPLLSNQEYRFEIYEMHQFGYNPEELSSVAIGKFTISNDETFSTWEVTSDRGNKLGFLSAKIRRKLKYVPNVTIAKPEVQILSISSIISTHLSSLKQKRGYVVVTVMGKAYRTQIGKSKSGELLFTEIIDIEKSDDIVNANVEIFSYDAKEDKSELIGTGSLNLDTEHPQRRVVIKNQKNIEIGDAFIDYKVVPKQSYETSKQLAKIIQQKARLDASRVDPYSNLSASKTLNASRMYDNTLLLHRSLKKSERVSVVNQNTKIFIPSEQRFKSYTDQQNNNVSYLRDKYQMDFKDPQAKVYYKGASIGKGSKLDFTNLHRSNPGVGGYNLPSIWDRY